MERKVVALIPARGGSSGVLRKNLAEVGGFSLLARACLSSQTSIYVSETYVSSDDPEMLSLSEKMGACAVERPSELANDFARAEGVVEHFLDCKYGRVLKLDDVLLYLQPTSPFRTSNHVDEALRLLFDSSGHGVISVKTLTEYPSKTLAQDGDGWLRSNRAPYEGAANRQDLDPLVYPNGAIYAFTVRSFREAEGFPVEGSKAFVMDAMSSIDIDTPEDLEIARGVAIYAGI